MLSIARCYSDVVRRVCVLAIRFTNTKSAIWHINKASFISRWIAKRNIKATNCY